MSDPTTPKIKTIVFIKAVVKMRQLQRKAEAAAVRKNRDPKTVHKTILRRKAIEKTVDDMIEIIGVDIDKPMTQSAIDFITPKENTF